MGLRYIRHHLALRRGATVHRAQAQPPQGRETRNFDPGEERAHVYPKSVVLFHGI